MTNDGLLCSMNGFVLSQPASWFERLWMGRSGYRFLGWGRRSGWRGELPLYERAGQVTYPQGYDQRLQTSPVKEYPEADV